MALSYKGTPALELKGFFKKYPWLWGVTKRWYPGSDLVEVKTLTVSALKQMAYSCISDLPPGERSSWFVYQKLRNGTRQVDSAGKYGTRRGTPMASVIRRLPGVVFLIELKWADRGKRMYRQMYRHITLYEVPWGQRGSRLKSLCARALKK